MSTPFASQQSIRDQLFSFQNIVCESSLSSSFPHLIILALATNGRCEPQLFPAAVARLLQTGCTISIFAVNRVMVMGRATVFDSYLALVFLCDMINRIIPGMDARIDHFHVVNRVASVKLGCNLDIERLATDYKQFGLWEKASFPGFKLAMDDLQCTMVIFPQGGKVNIAGVKSHKWLPYIARRMEMFRPYVIEE